MQFRRSLRHRVGFSFALFGGLISLLLSAVLYLGTQDIERGLIAETLTAELDEYANRFQVDPHSPPPSSLAIRTFIDSSKVNDAPAPPQFAALKDGFHRVEFQGKSHFLVIARRGGDRFFLLYDEARAREREHRYLLFLASGVVAMTLLSAALGGWLTGRVISPVVTLARRIGGLRAEDRLTPVAGDFTNDEVGELAAAFDKYLMRLHAFIERERYFTSDVSHELRTPLTVINGATEVLLASPGLEGAARERVGRIARAAREMSELTAALLTLAREERGPAGAATSCSVGNVLRDVIENHAYLLKDKPVEVDIEREGNLQLPVERAVLAIVVGNLIRNAFAYTERGRITARVTRHGIEVEDTGSGMSPQDLDRAFERFATGPHSGGSGIGLSLVKRICDRYGWEIAIESQPGTGTRTSLRLVASGNVAHVNPVSTT
ncbi:MAG: HAMP domain-containing sensor histidine kinase [Gammaproteobacteria bacterium]